VSLLSKVTSDAPALPSRVVLYAPEKAGKTSFGCYAPKPIFLMTAGETGLLSLIESGQVPPTPHFPADFTAWPRLLDAVEALIAEPHEYKTLVLDTGNGAEQLLLAYVCGLKPFDGDWNVFNCYGRGLAAAIPLWGQFLMRLDDLRTRRKMAVLFLHHSRVKAFQNPSGKDWDQWKPEAVDKLWSLTHKWADVITFFGSKVTVTRDDKAVGQESRYLRCAPSAAIVAGNRYGMPDEITAPAGAANLWSAFARALQIAKAKARQPKAESPPPPAPVDEVTPDVEAAADPTPEPEPAHSPPPPPATPARLPDAVVQGVIDAAHKAKLTVPEVLARYGTSVGVAVRPDLHVSELTLTQAANLVEAIERDLKPKKTKAGAAA
jgi:hypothetical protein